MRARPSLRALAARLGILAAYVDQRGRIRRTADATRVALLRAMGTEAASERQAKQALRELEIETNLRLLPPVRVLTNAMLPLRVPLPERHPARRGAARWTAEVCEESGRTYRMDGRIRGGAEALTVGLPVALPAGYHTLRLALRRSDGAEHEGEQSLIVAPTHCPTPAELLGGRPIFGLLANLYTLRSARNWGVGNLSDLAALVRWCGEIGAAFVGVNPLHALDVAGGEVSPYSPVSRLYRNPLYLDVTAVPELAASPAARARLASPGFRAELARLRAAAHVEYDRVAALEGPVLAALHRTFAACHRDCDDARGRAYRRYLADEGEHLADFATFLALQEHLAGSARRTRDWHRWPAAYRDPRSAPVQRFRETHAERIDFHCYVQFELDRQLAAASRQGRAGGLALGIYQDLALGSSPDGSDTWAFPGLFRSGATLGAPPDELGPGGQDWSLPPIDPRGLARNRYHYWIRLLRAAFRHAGALRIDHVMGLFRQFWIPAGHSGAEGAYVRFPNAELLAILALESTRAGALVIGEDLGTVPAGLPRVLARWGILSTRVLYFERDGRGAFRASRRYPPHALVAANTHDLAPLAGYWTGRDLALRRATGQIASDAALAAASAGRARERRSLVRRLTAERLLPPGRAPTLPDLRAAVHAFLCRTPAALVGISLDDLVGELEPVNLPGVSLTDHPSWRRRLATPIETLARSPEVRRALAGTRKRRRARHRPR